mmetsp:Transcript_15559/g.48699  ORF Transcript_15559/g.48699 Transcript_15559/m.48699 type:complete len:208 (-) Transcript_15559:314-937(-)
MHTTSPMHVGKRAQDAPKDNRNLGLLQGRARRSHEVRHRPNRSQFHGQERLGVPSELTVVLDNVGRVLLALHGNLTLQLVILPIHRLQRNLHSTHLVQPLKHRAKRTRPQLSQNLNFTGKTVRVRLVLFKVRLEHGRGGTKLGHHVGNSRRQGGNRRRCSAHRNHCGKGRRDCRRGGQGWRNSRNWRKRGRHTCHASAQWFCLFGQQ